MSPEIIFIAVAAVVIAGLVLLIWIGLRRITRKVALIVAAVVAAVALFLLAAGGLATSVSTNAASTAASAANTASSAATTTVAFALLAVVCAGVPVMALAITGSFLIGRRWEQRATTAPAQKPQVRRVSLPRPRRTALLPAQPEVMMVDDESFPVELLQLPGFQDAWSLAEQEGGYSDDDEWAFGERKYA